eukprot:s157_g22.t1
MDLVFAEALHPTVVTALAFHCVLRHHALHGAPKLQAEGRPVPLRFLLKTRGISWDTHAAMVFCLHAFAVERRFPRSTSLNRSGTPGPYAKAQGQN